MQNAGSVFFLFEITFGQAASHLYAYAEHGLGHFNVLTLHERFGVFGKIESHQRSLVIRAAQFNAAIG
jgi:hypothetical protein